MEKVFQGMTERGKQRKRDREGKKVSIENEEGIQRSVEEGRMTLRVDAGLSLRTGIDPSMVQPTNTGKAKVAVMTSSVR